MPEEVLPDYLPRVSKLSRMVRDAEDAWRLLLRQRDEVIVDAVDNGISQRAVAAAAGMSRGRVVGILGNHDEEHLV